MNDIKRKIRLLIFIITIVSSLSCYYINYSYGKENKSYHNITLDNIPLFNGNYYVEINNNKPNFSPRMINTKSFENYGLLDNLGRCSTAVANISYELMPKIKRGSMGSVKPSGWHTTKYDSVDGKYLYNRCHLIGYQLTGENANKKNLITCTRTMNVKGMLPFENKVKEYIMNTNNHVLYRVTPIFKDNELVARGVSIEALSVEDNGEGISFNVYVYNNEPGITIDYLTGDSHN